MLASKRELLRRLARLLGGDHDRRAMRIVGTDEVHLMPAHLLKAHPDVCLYMLEQMAKMDRSIGGWQCTGD